MILVAGLSPAWQQIVVLDQLQRGEVNRAREVHWCASGKVINVALALHHLSKGHAAAGDSNSSRLLTIRGGSAGESIERELAEWQLSRRWVETSAPSRVCTTLLESPAANQATRTTEIVETARPISSDELAAFIDAFTAEAAQAKVIVLTGSLPAGSPADLYATLIARSASPVIVDVQGPPLAAACQAQPFLVKPNREELGRTLGRTLESDADVWNALRALQSTGPECVLITEGAQPVRLCVGHQRFRFTTLSVPIVNPIGCGDCLAGGLAWGLATGKDLPTSVRLGIAAAAENAGQLLPSRLNAETVQRLADRIEIEELS